MRITNGEKKAVQAVLDSEELSSFYRHFLGGGNVQAFEREFAEYIGVKHAVSVCHGTCAIFLALKCLPKKRRGPSYILTTPYTFVGTVSPIIHAGFEPYFMDVNLWSYNLDAEQALLAYTREPRFRNRFAGWMPVHLLGTPIQLDEDDGIPMRLIEDNAQGLGAYWDKGLGKKTGSMGFASCHSFQETKSLTSLGEGGMLCTNDALVYETALNLRNHGDKNRDAKYACWNLRLTEAAAAFGLIQLQHYPEIVGYQSRIANYFISQLPPQFKVQQCLPPAMPTRYIVGTTLDPRYNRDKVVAGINKRLKIKKPRRGWIVSRGYDRLISDLPAYKKYARPCPNARTILAYSVWFDIRAGTIDRVNMLLDAIEKELQ